MKKFLTKLLLGAIASLILMPVSVFAHQPRLNTQTETTIIEPEISKAYYGQLTGIPHYYSIKSEVPFNLYVNILVPDIQGQKTDVSAAIVKDKNTKAPLAVLDGINFKWEKFWEPFGRSWYLKGPECKTVAEAGEYLIVVWSSNNDSKYSLAVGEIESFSLAESAEALNLIPKIKRSFFNESPFNFILSPFGWGYILIMYAIAFVVGFIYKALFKKFAKNNSKKITRNINARGRWIRAAIGVVLLALAVFTTWNPILIFFSGFCIFEAIFSWCGIYAALGKNTCQV